MSNKKDKAPNIAILLDGNYINSHDSWLNVEIDGKKLLDINKDAIFEVMEREGVEKIIASYCGSGDTGDVDYVEYVFSKDKKKGKSDRQIKKMTDAVQNKIVSVYMASSYFDKTKKEWVSGIFHEREKLGKFIEDFVFSIARLVSPGWEIDAGGGGTLTLNLKNRSASLEHYENCVTQEYKEMEF